MKKIFVLFLSLIMASVLLLPGCVVKLPKGSGTLENETANSNVSLESTADVENNKTEDEVDPAISLNSLRQLITDESKEVGISFLGTVEDGQEVNTLEWIKKSFPKLCKEYPFITKIDKEQIIGSGYGELFLVVPKDDMASIAVNGAVLDNDEILYENVLYRSEEGSPILLWCNNSGIEPNMEINIVSNEGKVFKWYPKLDDNKRVDVLYDENENDLKLDFSPYEEVLALSYSNYINLGYKNPSVEDLFGTTWYCEQLLNDWRLVSYFLIFNEWTVDVYWNDGIDIEHHEYKGAPYELINENGYTILKIDFREMAGKLSFNLLIDKTNNSLFVMQDVSKGELKENSDSLMRIMTKQNIAKPIELVGSWNRVKTEVEGDKVETPLGDVVIDIFGDSENEMYISYNDKSFPDSSYANKKLEIAFNELHYNCGNPLWLVNVDYVDDYGTTFALTLLNDGSLLLQNYWIMDGAPMVSYEWFEKAE